ncbi:short-subunit dehydrogenase [Herbihabitans rhizosphaerae]|uniref:Short-subunit dehydrogenase n=1 Tax=Herbihabitans rhizosphaerae TaxID=1872711 RepID=A0A4Q7KE70_9PSEU|nr:SDR family NAD(P)-dependent oxidoreductase [Herbihabitans rhizosphaerae]RZS31130.1 short-subunit dehydrogenase [Herbihabitans rhizosphaerae]
MSSFHGPTLAGRRVLITGGARGIGAALARRMHERGARVAIAGLEPKLLADVAWDCGDAPWRYCDVGDRVAVDAAVNELVGELGGLDVVVANAGIAAQFPLVHGDPEVLEQTLRVNVLGTYYTLRAAGPHVSHPLGYALPIASMAAAVHLPLLGAYSASKAAVEALGDTLREELRHTGAQVGVGYFTEIDTDMTSRGFGTAAAKALTKGKSLSISSVLPLDSAIDALERGIARRSRRIVAPRWVGPALHVRMALQRIVAMDRRLASVPEALRVAADEKAPLTTPQPERGDHEQPTDATP